ncbi:MAG: hypothetical protein PHW73_11720 [Atribacterota bacterium]|nr:hypothetical protein [Atribacterota bacterium]
MYKLEEERWIAVSDVELIRISNFNIYVKGLDADGDSPVLDIKMAKNRKVRKIRGLQAMIMILKTILSKKKDFLNPLSNI